MRPVPGGQLGRLDELIIPLVTARAPGLLAIYGPARALRRCCSSRPGITPGGCAARRPGRTCAASPRSPHHRGNSPATGTTPGDRQANHALWRIVFTRLGSDPATRAYAERRTAEGKSKAEIIRCLKRYVAREVYRQLRPAAG